MKERTKNAGQLFVLTHNFGFFRQVRNWFNHLPHQNKADVAERPARFYMLDAQYDGHAKSSVIKVLDPLLHEFESEYHYLFKKICETAQNTSPGTSLAVYYALPNMARRLLEAFLAFRYPSLSGNLHKQMEQVHSIDPAKKARLLRFTHTHSHDPQVPEPEHDLSILSETPQVLRDLLDLMEAEDRGHFEEMIKVAVPAAETTNAVADAWTSPAILTPNKQFSTIKSTP
jgi:wobble nucleotide-excising tRNase